MPETGQLGSQIDRFVRAYRRVLADDPDNGDAALRQERDAFLSLLPAVREAPLVLEPPVERPIRRYIEEAHDTEGAPPALAELISASLPLARKAVWRNKYRTAPGRQALFKNFAYCDFVGTDGWLKTPDVTLGLTLLGPGTDYPFHAHPARELYLVLSGTSDWAVDYQPLVTRRQGAWLLHTEMQPHAIRSLETPMLALSAWRGNVHARSRFISQKHNEIREENT